MTENGGEIDLAIDGFGPAIEIGRGGFGVVYRVREEDLNRDVAVKVLATVVLERFDRERWAMGTLTGHPNIVSVLATGQTASGHPYIVMPYVAGGSLADRIDRERPLPWTEVVRIAIKLAGALETAHRAGTLHRDVKPDNVLVSEYGEPQLTDFGIASVAGRFDTETRRPAMSVLHAAPELLDGRPASAVSDVYSLASTMFALMTGRAPFWRSDEEQALALFQRIAHDPVPDLRGRGVPDVVWRAVESAMEKDPRRRPASAAELGHRLQEAQRRLGVPVTEMALLLPEGAARPAADLGGQARAAPGVPSTPPGRATEDAADPVPVPPVRPRRRGLVGVAAVALAAAAVISAAVWSRDRPSSRTERTVAPTTTAEAGGGCVSTYFAGVPEDRRASVEIGARGVTIVGAEQPKELPGGLRLVEAGQPIAAVRYRFSPASDLFTIESVVDGACRPVEDFANATNPRSDKHTLKNFEHLYMTVGGETYDIVLGGTATIRVNVIRVVR